MEGGEGMVIRNEDKSLVAFLKVHELLNRTKIIPNMYSPGWFYTRKKPFPFHAKKHSKIGLKWKVGLWVDYGIPPSDYKITRSVTSLLSFSWCNLIYLGLS